MNVSTLNLVLTIISGLCWTIVYIEGIRLGFKQRTYAVPFYALALNLAWELIHTVRGVRSGADVQTVINGIWLLFDVGILWTYLAFGKKYFSRSLPQYSFVVWTLLGLITAFCVEYAFVKQFGGFAGGAYAAFLQNLLMSVLFINMLVQRGNREGQSLSIAICKWIGTLAPTIVFGWIGGDNFSGPNFLILVVGLLCTVFDLTYFFLLIRTKVV